MRKVLAYSILLPVSMSLFLEGCKKLTCGDGTSEKDGECVAAMGGGGSGNVDRDIELEFDGVKAVAAASETSLLAVWEPVDREDVSYNVYVASSKDGFNYAQPQAQVASLGSSALISGLKSKGTFYVAVRGVVDGEVVANSKVVEVTLKADKAAPKFAGVVDAEPAPNASVKVSWDPASDDVTPKEAITYFIYYGESAETVNFQVPLAASLPGASSAEVQLPLPETEYFFAVRAQDASGQSDDNVVVAAAESGEDTTPPEFGGCSSSVARSASSIVASWRPATDDIASTEQLTYNVYAAESVDALNFAAPDVSVTGGASTGAVLHLKQNTPYVVVCRVQDPSGNEDDNMVLTNARTKDDGTPPEFTGPVAVVESGTSTASLSWPAGTDNKSTPAQLIYAVFVSQFEEDLIAFDPASFPVFAESKPGETSIVLENLTSNSRYYAVVLAKDGGENYSELTSPIVFDTAVSFLNDVMIGIIGPRQCASTECHQGSTATGQLSLEVDVAWSNLVNVDAKTALGSGFKRVLPGDAENSHLVHRVKAIGPIAPPNDTGNRMPLDGDTLSNEAIATIERWINEGALDN